MLIPAGSGPSSYNNDEKEIWNPGWSDKEEIRHRAYLESQCSYSTPPTVMYPPPPPHRCNKTGSGPQLLKWLESGTWCSWSNQVPSNPDRSCGSLHRCGLNPDDGQKKIWSDTQLHHEFYTPQRWSDISKRTDFHLNQLRNIYLPVSVSCLKAAIILIFCQSNFKTKDLNQIIWYSCPNKKK